MASSSGADRFYLVGETVHLHVKVSKPGTRTPDDPATVALTTLKLGTESMLEGVPTTAFTRNAQGDYTLTIPTAGFPPGTYSLAVRLANGAEAVVLLTDSFVVKAA
jgi:hypothetical protein